MAVIIKPLVYVSCVAGIGSAIGVPVTYAVKNSWGGGGLTSDINLVQCSGTEEQEIVSYGSQESKNVCWFISPTKDLSENQIEDNDKIYTILFKNMWENKTLSWSESFGKQWRDQCTQGGKTWYLSKSEGDEYLGLCDDSFSDRKQWVTIENKNEGQLQIKVCQGECWQPSSDQWTGIQVLSNKSGNWQEVKFRKHNSLQNVPENK